MWSRIPLVRLIFPFMAGIILAEYIPADPVFLLRVSAAAVLAGGIFYGLLFGYATKWMYGITIVLFMFTAGYAMLIAKKESGEAVRRSVSDGERVYCIRTKGPFEAREKSYRVTAGLVVMLDSMDWSAVKGNIMLYVKPDSLLLDVKPGSYLLLRVKLDSVKPPQNPSEFDYGKYLSRKGTFFTAYLDSGKYSVIRNENGMGIMDRASGIRINLLRKLKEHGISGRNFALASALLLGDDTHLDAGIRDIYARAGAMHILCVSGLHVGVVFLVLGYLFGFMKRLRPGKILLPVILMTGVWSYAMLTGLAPPVVRASCMISFFIMGDTMRRHKNSFNTLAASAMLMLLIDPELLFSAGFQLSYSAVLGIFTLRRPVYHIVFVKAAIPDKIWAITAVSVAAQAGTLPVVLYYFHQFPLYSLITNLIVIPMSSFIIYAGITFFILPSNTMIINAASWLLNKLVTVMDTGVGFVEDIPYGMLEGVNFDLIQAVLLAIFIGLISVTLVEKKKQGLIFGLLVLLLLSAYRTHIQYNALQQDTFIVYSVRGHSAYDVIHGKDHSFCADSVLLSSPGKIEYSIAPTWLDLNLNNPTTHTLNAKPYTLNVKRKRALVWTKNIPPVPPEQKLSLDYLILRGNLEFNIEDIFKYFDAKLIIIDFSVPPWVNAPEGDERFYDVRERGALVID